MAEEAPSISEFTDSDRVKQLNDIDRVILILGSPNLDILLTAIQGCD